MVRYVSARYVGGEKTDSYYQHGQIYPLAIKVRFFRKRVSIYKRRGYYDDMQEGTLREFRDLESFERLFDITHEEGIE